MIDFLTFMAHLLVYGFLAIGALGGWGFILMAYRGARDQTEGK